MLDVNKIVRAKLLETNIPVYLEHFLDSKSTIPCISYTEFNNITHKDGDSLCYSQISFTVKIWAKDYSDIITDSILVDSKMKELGFTRISTNDIWLDGLGQRVMRYQNLALQYYN